MPNKYIEQFLSLNCSGDVLNACLPINNASKEITEAMAMVRQIKSIVMGNKMRYTLVDLCAGNALTAIIAVHLLPIRFALAVDKKPVQRPHHEDVKRFMYCEFDLYNPMIVGVIAMWAKENRGELIISATHPCSNLAHRVIEIYKSVEAAKHLILMPCCQGKYEGKYPEVMREKLGKYLLWSWDLAQQAKGTMMVDKYILSPCNAVITASQKE
jgi:hypothetical protein